MEDSTSGLEKRKRSSSASSSPSTIDEPATVPAAPIPHTASSIITPSTAPFLTWSPVFIPPWGATLLPAAFYPSALRNALPG
ncbi:unnamed protein product [Hermetia illucens]|uniref:Uncharacterized protein n=1 Tax=Hermetia illucens TaxID=343691 RepID=A0A7R8YV50_HERIL|nr:unnamed protein product [Hermetia illucens]